MLLQSHNPAVTPGEHGLATGFVMRSLSELYVMIMKVLSTGYVSEASATDGELATAEKAWFLKPGKPSLSNKSLILHLSVDPADV